MSKETLPKICLMGYEFEIVKYDRLKKSLSVVIRFEGIKQVRLGDRLISFKVPLSEEQFFAFVNYANNAWLL